MTHITKRKIDSGDYQKAQQELVALVARLNKRTAPFFINDLLTESERIMLVKRFAVVFMFHHGYSAYRASDVLGVSISTALKLRAQYEQRKFHDLLGCYSKKEQNRFLEFIELLILAKASPRARVRLFNNALNMGR